MKKTNPNQIAAAPGSPTPGASTAASAPSHSLTEVKATLAGWEAKLELLHGKLQGITEFQQFLQAQQQVQFWRQQLPGKE